MADLDKNAQALVQYFIRGMRRYAKHVRAEEQVGAKTLHQRVDAAYFLAYGQFIVEEKD